ncbi:MAG: hypothetical protein CL927_11930, partial [Deltaproteobacteria bacterium]|nr:hypothetical protein [Deltaproteobacteria bacterium]
MPAPRTFFGRIALFVLQRPRVVWAGFLVVTLLSIVSALQLRVDPNLMVLLPEDHPTTVAIERVTAEEGGTNLVTLAFRGDEPDRRDAALARLVVRLEGLDGVDYALYDLDEELAWQLGILQLSVDELDAIRTRLQGAVALGPAAANPFVAQRLLDLGPLTETLANGGNSRAILPSDDGLARVLVRPSGPAYDARFAGPFLGRLEAEIAAFAAEEPAIELVWIGGAHRHSVEDVETIRHDLTWTAGVSALLVLSFITLAFRDLRATLLVFTPLIFANLWTTGMATLTVGSLNTFTSFYPAILVGLGVDFALHLYSRYREERSTQESVEAAICAAWDHTGPPCFTAAITSAGGFCALWIAGFGGFRQLGTLLAGGVLLCLLSVLLMLPLLISWRDRQRWTGAARDERSLPGAARTGPVWAAPVGLLVLFLLAAGAATQLHELRFLSDLSELRREGLSYADLSDAERTAASTSFSPVMASFSDDATLAEAHARLSARLADEGIPYVGSILSIYSVLPADQAERLARLEAIRTLALNPNIQFLPLAARENLSALSEQSPRALTPADLPRGLRHVLGAEAPRPRMVLIPDGNQWDLEENGALKASVAEVLPEAEAAGQYLALAVLYELVADDIPWVSGIALLVVFTLSWLDLRRLAGAVSTVLALGVGMVWSGAGMVLLDIPISMVNFVGVPILMGIGVDVIIHLMHRVREEGPGGVRRALATTGWAS